MKEIENVAGKKFEELDSEEMIEVCGGQKKDSRIASFILLSIISFTIKG